jgi:sRNA-binding protein
LPPAKQRDHLYLLLTRFLQRLNSLTDDRGIVRDGNLCGVTLDVERGVYRTSALASPRQESPAERQEKQPRNRNAASNEGEIEHAKRLASDVLTHARNYYVRRGAYQSDGSAK